MVRWQLACEPPHGYRRSSLSALPADSSTTCSIAACFGCRTRKYASPLVGCCVRTSAASSKSRWLLPDLFVLPIARLTAPTEPHTILSSVDKTLERGGSMKRNVRLVVGILTFALTGPGILITPIGGYAQTQSKERRDDRQDDRKESRDTKQEGRQDARTKKAGCKKGDEKSRAECRQDKRGTKQDAREGAREIKKD